MIGGQAPTTRHAPAFPKSYAFFAQRQQGHVSRRPSVKTQAFQLFQRPRQRARDELLKQLGGGAPARKDSPSAAELVAQILAEGPPPFNERLLNGEWRVMFTQGVFLWQAYTAPWPGNKASQEFDVSSRSVVNRGDILGASVQVSAVGKYFPANGDKTVPKEVRVKISGGTIRAFNRAWDVPIRGEGLFYIDYLDEDIRIFRSPGGGRTVQVNEQTLAKLQSGRR